MQLPAIKVGTRLYAGFGLVLALMVGLIIISITQLNRIGEINTRIVDKDWRKADAANAIDTGMRANSRNTLELLLSTDKAHAAKIQQRIENTRQSIDTAFATLGSLLYLPEGVALLDDLKRARGKYVASFSKVVRLVNEERHDEAVALMNRETLPLLDAMQVHISAMLALQKKTVDASSHEAQQDIATARALMLAFGAAAMLIGVGAAVLITRTLLAQLGGEPDYAVAIAGRIARGDLAVHIATGAKDQSSLLFAIKAMRDGLADIVSQVRSGTDAIATATGQIASGNLDLSSRTEHQASALEQTAASMEELTSTVKQNGDNARQAQQLAASASAIAVKGGCVVTEMVGTMGSINESSRRIADIIGVIDGIAFQTNILALNAAVEAARAGEQGRGFAVVAAEVRGLAQRSAQAASEIKVLIGDSVGKVDAGSRLVGEAGATMDEIVASVKRVTDIMSEIAAASHEQEAGIGQINQAIGEMDGVTQQNAALVEEAAAAAGALQEQAGSLARVASIFRLAAAPAAAVNTVAPGRAAPRPAAGRLRVAGHAVGVS